MILGWTIEEWSSGQHFSKYAPDREHIGSRSYFRRRVIEKFRCLVRRSYQLHQSNSHKQRSRKKPRKKKMKKLSGYQLVNYQVTVQKTEPNRVNAKPITTGRWSENRVKLPMLGSVISFRFWKPTSSV